MRKLLLIVLIATSTAGCGLESAFHRFLYTQEVKAFEALLEEYRRGSIGEADFVALREGYRQLINSYQREALFLDEEAHDKMRQLRRAYLKNVVRYGSQELRLELKKFIHAQPAKTFAL